MSGEVNMQDTHGMGIQREKKGKKEKEKRREVTRQVKDETAAYVSGLKALKKDPELRPPVSTRHAH